MEDQSVVHNINRLVVAVIQEQDVEMAEIALKHQGFRVNRLSSAGGFLGQRNVTLLIGLDQSLEEKMFQTIRQTCKSRIEYVTLPVEGSLLPMPSPTPITVGGATLFSFDVERFEEF
jgi:uncharacterized protein YaaQ